ncbi:MAG: hemolysin family protein [Bacteroidota bacterium]
MDILTIIIISLLLSGFFSGMEIAYVNANKLKLEVDKKSGGFFSGIFSRFAKTDSGFISTMLVGNNISLVIFGIAFAIFLEGLLTESLPQNLNNDLIILLLQIIITFLIVFVFAEFIPKLLFRINANNILRIAVLPVTILYYLLYPIVFITLNLSEFILKRILKVNIVNNTKAFDSIDINSFLQEFSEHDAEKEETIEMQMFKNAIEFPDIKLRESMIPRTEIVALDEKDSLDSFRKKFYEKGLSKILIYSENIDNVVGYVHAFDFFKKPQNIKSIIRPLIVVPETMHVNKLLKIFIQQNRSIALVVDEFGGTAGLITIEDVMEEIFGEIDDEYDTDIFTEKKINENTYIFSARLEIDHLNEKYELNLPESDEYETLGGLIINYHESIPFKNQVIEMEPFIFKILQVNEKRIEQVELKTNVSK